MTPDQIVTPLIQACERRDLDLVCSLVTDDIEYDNVPIGKVSGPDRVRDVLSRGVSAAAERIDRFLVDGHWVQIPIAAIFRVRDERVFLWRDYFDLKTYRKQRA